MICDQLRGLNEMQKMSSCRTSCETKSKYVLLNIEGTVIKTMVTTCKSIPGSLLESLDESSEYFDTSTGTFYFDRNVSLFGHILAAHREGELHVPRDVCPLRFRKEVKFWGIPHKLIAPCCWKYYYECDDDVKTLNDVIDSMPRKQTACAIGDGSELHSKKIYENADVPKDEKALTDAEIKASLHHRIWLFLDEPRTSTAAKIWCFVYMFIVIISVILNVIWLDTGVRVDPYLVSFWAQYNEQELYEITMSNETIGNLKIQSLLFTDPHKALFAFDCFCTIFFAIETIVHFAVCPNKGSYILSPYNDLKILLSVCMVVGLIFEVRKDWLTSKKVGIIWFMLKSMNTLRILLILRLHKLYNNLNLVYLSMKRSVREMMLLLVLFGFTIVIYGGLIFSMEIESEMFPDTRKAMWWALITMTTIGYGDYYPTDALGYVIGLLCAINGLIVIALPIAAISSNFSVIYGRYSDLQKHVNAVQKDGEKRLDEERKLTRDVVYNENSCNIGIKSNVDNSNIHNS